MIAATLSRALCAMLVLSALGQPGAASPLVQGPSQESGDHWTWRVAPYLWATDIDGSLSASADSVDIDVGFDDIWDNLSGAGLLLIETGTDRFRILADVVYLDLENDATGPLGASASVEMETFIGDLGGLFRLSPGSPYELGGGLRYASFGNDVTIGPVSFDADRDVLDAVVAGRATWSIAESWSLAVYGDVGAGDSELTWQASAMLGWHAGSWGVAAGYRGLDYDIESSNGDVDLTIHGLLFGLDFRF